MNTMYWFHEKKNPQSPSSIFLRPSASSSVNHLLIASQGGRRIFVSFHNIHFDGISASSIHPIGAASPLIYYWSLTSPLASTLNSAAIHSRPRKREKLALAFLDSERNDNTSSFWIWLHQQYAFFISQRLHCVGLWCVRFFVWSYCLSFVVMFVLPSKMVSTLRMATWVVILLYATTLLVLVIFVSWMIEQDRIDWYDSDGSLGSIWILILMEKWLWNV